MNSEDIKNWVATASILVGGIWVLYQWNTIFPKTKSEVTISAAALRARTLGDISVTLVPTPDGTAPTTAQGEDFSQACQKEQATRMLIQIPARIVLRFTSNAPIPVRVEVTDLLLMEMAARVPAVMTAGKPPIFIADTLGPVQSAPLPEGAFLGGLRWTHVEPQGSSVLAIVGALNLPFSCGAGGSSWTAAEFAIGLKANVRAIDISGTLGEIVDRYFYQVCRVNADGGSTCAIAKAATGDAPTETGSTFKVFGQ